ncbi:hypothetical protein Bpfe_001364 [Biomphalaria pfeifferi]|uniref:Uncharacterized protein n=1 Tax=Biomphalaria pfeifferi TaxID=112525 RepID=A0AAD8FLA2_BIOPF|nr:hypothetical protein Bpfe_001364 [Biomphalaria pfeifferi]
MLTTWWIKVVILTKFYILGVTSEVIVTCQNITITFVDSKLTSDTSCSSCVMTQETRDCLSMSVYSQGQLIINGSVNWTFLDIDARSLCSVPIADTSPLTYFNTCNVTFYSESHVQSFLCQVSQIENRYNRENVSRFQVYINTSVCAFSLVIIFFIVLILAKCCNSFKWPGKKVSDYVTMTDNKEEAVEHECNDAAVTETSCELRNWVVISPSETEGVPTNFCYITPADLDISRHRLKPIRKSILSTTQKLMQPSALKNLFPKKTNSGPPKQASPRPPPPCRKLSSNPHYVNTDDGYIKMTLPAKTGQIESNNNGYVSATSSSRNIHT